MEEAVVDEIAAWQSIGFAALIIFGFLLHYTYEWSHHSPIVGIFSAVNESVWEHLKLGFWALCLYSLFEYWFLKDTVNNYFLAKASGILALQLFIVVFFYSYTSILGKHILGLDIGSYVAASALCQFISYKILTSENHNAPANTIGIIILFLHALILVIFTYMPPRFPIFLDSRTKKYGTEWNVKS